MKLNSLPSISPSRLQALRDCALRVLLERTFPQSILPPTPLMLVGQLIHKVAERAFIEAPGNQAELEQVWQREMEAMESQLSSKPNRAMLVPLRYSVPNFAVRQAQFIQTWKYRSHSTGSGTPLQGGAEKVLADEAKQVIGKVDLIIRSPAGWVIKDFKSGKIFDSETGKVKSDYEIQLKLYAALCRNTYQEYPVKLCLIDAAGVEVEIPFTPEECAALLVEAQQLLATINQQVIEGQLETLASPDPERCRWCMSRAVCPLYTEQLRTCPDTLPHDLLGTHVSHKLVGDRLQVVLESNGTRRKLLAVGRVSKSLDYQLSANVGKEVLLCNVRVAANQLTFTATEITCAVPVNCD